MPSQYNFGGSVGNAAADKLRAQRVAQMRSMAQQVQNASGTPNPTGNGRHQWSGVVRGGQVQNATYTPPTPKPAPTAPTQPRPPASGGMNMMSYQDSYTPPAPKVTTTPVDGAALGRQIQQLQRQAPQPPAPRSASSRGSFLGPSNDPADPRVRLNKLFNQQQPAAPPSAPSPATSAGAWANQTNAPGAISSPLSATSTAFNNATGQQDPPHIITTDNGRKFNTQTKTFLDGRPGGFAR